MGKSDFEREYGVIKELNYDRQSRGFTNDSKDTFLEVLLIKTELVQNMIYMKMCMMVN